MAKQLFCRARSSWQALSLRSSYLRNNRRNGSPSSESSAIRNFTAWRIPLGSKLRSFPPDRVRFDDADGEIGDRPRRADVRRFAARSLPLTKTSRSRRLQRWNNLSAILFRCSASLSLFLGSFSALALVLASIGIYGVISYSVAQRKKEIGIRMALGAQSGDVFRMMIGQGAKIAGAGVLIGILASLCLTRFMTSLLFCVSSADPLTFAAVTVALVLTAMLASYIPVRRTLRVDAVSTLRCE